MLTIEFHRFDFVGWSSIKLFCSSNEFECWISHGNDHRRENDLPVEKWRCVINSLPLWKEKKMSLSVLNWNSIHSACFLIATSSWSDSQKWSSLLFFLSIDWSIYLEKMKSTFQSILSCWIDGRVKCLQQMQMIKDHFSMFDSDFLGQKIFFMKSLSFE